MTSIPRESVRDQAVEAGAKARYEDTFSDPDEYAWDELEPAERQDWVDVMSVALDAALPVILDEIEERIDSEHAPEPGTPHYAVGNGTFNEGLAEALAAVRRFRAENGWGT